MRSSGIRAGANEELRSYLDARVEHLVVRGVPSGEARLEAERRLGGTVDDVRDALEQSALQRERKAADAIVRSELRRLVPNADAVTFNPMSKYLEPELRPWPLGATLFAVFGLLALAVSTVGVYGVVAYSFSQRTHELGVRTALGANVGDTYKLVLGEALRLTVIGVTIGVLLALALGLLIASQLYSTSAKDPFVIAIVASVLLTAGIAASLLPAWRATRADPMVALRTE
jgi:ABC-type antimicrobial peptide transport system permease subunit